MRRVTLLLLICAVDSTARGKNLPSGEASNDSASAAATLLDAVGIKQAVGAEVGGGFTVIEVTLSPKGGKTIDVTLDDFLLRDDSNGDHTGPVVAVQVVGTGGIVLHKQDVPTGGSSPAEHEVTGITKATSASTVNASLLDAVKKKVLPEKTISAPITGPLFFPLENRKAKNLDLVYSTANGKLHIKFR